MKDILKLIESKGIELGIPIITIEYDPQNMESTINITVIPDVIFECGIWKGKGNSINTAIENLTITLGSKEIKRNINDLR